jgi:hypothetical protein
MLEVNGEKFYRFFDVCPLLYKEKFISDANRLINEGYEASNNIPPVQTLNRTYQDKTKGLEHWDFLFNYINEKLEIAFNKNFYLTHSWINISKENNRYGMHTHPTDLTCVYYVKNNYPEYGTNIDDKFIVPFVENSLLFFNGKIRHSITNLPYELAIHPHNHRYTIVFDFNYEKK